MTISQYRQATSCCRVAFQILRVSLSRFPLSFLLSFFLDVSAFSFSLFCADRQEVLRFFLLSFQLFIATFRNLEPLEPCFAGALPELIYTIHLDPISVLHPLAWLA